MTRFFNTAGVCEPRDHYMVPPLDRLPDVVPLIDRKSYFVVHAPRQSGKTTCFHHLARELTASGRFAAQLASCETARTVGDDVDRGVTVVVEALGLEAGGDLPEELRPRDCRERLCGAASPRRGLPKSRGVADRPDDRPRRRR